MFKAKEDSLDVCGKTSRHLYLHTAEKYSQTGLKSNQEQVQRERSTHFTVLSRCGTGGDLREASCTGKQRAAPVRPVPLESLVPPTALLGFSQEWFHDLEPQAQAQPVITGPPSRWP